MACNEILLTEPQGVALGWYDRRRWRHGGDIGFASAYTGVSARQGARRPYPKRIRLFCIKMLFVGKQVHFVLAHSLYAA
jgi:hypothetical protein